MDRILLGPLAKIVTHLQEFCRVENGPGPSIPKTNEVGPHPKLCQLVCRTCPRLAMVAQEFTCQPYLRSYCPPQQGPRMQGAEDAKLVTSTVPT